MIWMIVNPTAGTGRGAKVGALLDGILSAKGVEHKTVYTERPGHATELADEAAKDPNILHEAPHNTPISRPDETTAARNPILKFQDTI